MTKNDLIAKRDETWRALRAANGGSTAIKFAPAMVSDRPTGIVAHRSQDEAELIIDSPCGRRRNTGCFREWLQRLSNRLPSGRFIERIDGYKLRQTLRSAANVSQDIARKMHHIGYAP